MGSLQMSYNYNFTYIIVLLVSINLFSALSLCNTNVLPKIFVKPIVT